MTATFTNYPSLADLLTYVFDADEHEAQDRIDFAKKLLTDLAADIPVNHRGEYRVAYRQLLEGEKALHAMFAEQQAAEMHAEGAYLRAAESNFGFYDDPRGD